MDPKPEKNANLPQLPEQCTGAGAGSVPAGNTAEQPPGDDGLTRSDLAANRPNFARLAKLMVEAHEQAEAAEKQAAIASGELVPSPDGSLLPADDLALEPGNTPPQPPNVPPTAHAQGIVLSKVITKSGVEIYVDATWRPRPQPSTLRVCAKWPNQEPVAILCFTGQVGQGVPDDIQLAISDDGLYTTVVETDAPDIHVAVFETEHLLRPNEWADPDDPFNEAIDCWCAELISPDGKTWSLRPTAEDKKQREAAELKFEPWWEQIPGEHPSLVRHKGSSREYLLAVADPDPSGQQIEEHSIYRHGDTQQELTPEEEQELKAHFLRTKMAEPVEDILDPETGKPLATIKRYPKGIHRESVGKYRIGIEPPYPEGAKFRMIPVDQIHQIAPFTAEEPVPTEWTEINPRRQQLGE